MTAPADTDALVALLDELEAIQANYETAHGEECKRLDDERANCRKDIVTMFATLTAAQSKEKAMSEREELVKRLDARIDAEYLQRRAASIAAELHMSMPPRELERLLIDCRKALSAQPQGRCVAPPCKCAASNQQRCAYWQEAQPQGEPVAWQQRYIDPEEGPSIWQHADEATAKCLKDRADYELRPLYTAPPSGVREGMLRAAEICKGILVECIKNKKERGDHAVIAMCREAITRAADQVNVEDYSKVPMGPVGASYIGDTILPAPQSEQTHVRVPVAESHCVWMQDSDGPWNTSCGHVFEFTDGGPHQNDAAWCQYCGGKLLPQYHDAEQESVERNAALLRATAGKKESEHGKR